jgi:hypothetical protein
VTAPAQTPTPTRGVPVELGGRTLYFRYTLGTLRKIREKFGATALESGVADEALAEVILMGLLGSDPTLTVDQIEDMIDLPTLPVVVEAMRKAMGDKAKASIHPQPPTPAAGEAGASG